MAVQTWQSRDCTVTLDEATGATRVSGPGGMGDYSMGQVPWEDYKSKMKSLTIELDVFYIGSYTFFNCTELRALTISDNVQTIGYNAFALCSGLSGKLIIPDNVITIALAAFNGCTGFTGTLTLPSKIQTIGDYAFEGCSGFTGHLIIPGSVTDIGGSAFSGCTGLESITIPKSVTWIGNNAFSYMDSMKKIANYAKTQTVASSAFEYSNPSALYFGYPENTQFRTAAGDRWRDISELPHVVTLESKEGMELYPRTKGEAVYLDSGKTLEAALGGLSFWRGTQAEYNALSPKLDKTVYCIIGGSVIVT